MTELSPPTAKLVDQLRYELIPMKGIEDATTHLAPASPVSVTCSPVKGIDATIELSEKLIASGHDVVPHFAARLVTGPDHVEKLANWLRSSGLRRLFVIAGDAETPEGPYEGAAPFLTDLLSRDTGLEHVGVTGYPDGHSIISPEVQNEALTAKQQILADAGVSGSISTQMCFDPDKIHSWIVEKRQAGITLPIELGIPGVVDRARLLRMGTRLGIGPSLRFLKKNKSAVGQLLAAGGYDPTELITELGNRSNELGISGLHCFTFNSVADTRQWQENLLGNQAA